MDEEVVSRGALSLPVTQPLMRFVFTNAEEICLDIAVELLELTGDHIIIQDHYGSLEKFDGIFVCAFKLAFDPGYEGQAVIAVDGGDVRVIATTDEV
jgi:hypothetical protein